MVTQPVALLAPARAMPLDERPERARVIWNTQVTELMHYHVVEHFERREYEPPVEGERAARGARAPKSALPSDTDSPVRDADALGPPLRQH